MISQHMEAVVKNMVLHPSTYENFNFLGDFNAGINIQLWLIVSICTAPY